MRLAAIFTAILCASTFAADPILTSGGEGDGPTRDGDVIHLLHGGEKEVNSVLLPATATPKLPGSFEVRGTVTFDPGGEGFGLLLMNADIVGNEAPVQTVDQWEEPNRLDSIGIGFDSKNVASTDAFDADGNLYDRPQREISVHVDGREILNRQSDDFATGKPVPIDVKVEYVPGGALLTVQVGETKVYDAELIASVKPMNPRVALGARAGAAVKLDVKDLGVKVGPPPATPLEAPIRVGLFQDTIVSLQTAREATAIVDFSRVPENTARVIATIKLAAPPDGMDKWDRRAALYLYGPDRQRFELVRFKTPFAREWEWQVDVTDYLPLFKDQRTVGLFIDTWRDGFQMTASLDFYPGKLDQRPVAVVNLWQGEPILGDPKMPIKNFFDTKTVIVPKGAMSAKVRISASGHGQFPNSKNAAEFLALNRTLTVNGQTFSNLLWKTDNYLNPCRPQKGTWKYDRAGWGPGAITPPWSIDITPIMKTTRELTMDYAITDEYVNEHIGKGDPPTQWMDGQVIFYGTAPTTRPAK